MAHKPHTFIPHHPWSLYPSKRHTKNYKGQSSSVCDDPESRQRNRDATAGVFAPELKDTGNRRTCIPPAAATTKRPRCKTNNSLLLAGTMVLRIMHPSPYCSVCSSYKALIQEQHTTKQPSGGPTDATLIGSKRVRTHRSCPTPGEKQRERPRLRTLLGKGTPRSTQEEKTPPTRQDCSWVLSDRTAKACFRPAR